MKKLHVINQGIVARIRFREDWAEELKKEKKQKETKEKKDVRKFNR